MSDATTQPRIDYAVDGRVATLTFNQPARLNAVTFDMWTALPELIGAAERDSTVRVIALAGAGDRAFGAGADISEFEQWRSRPEAIATYDLAVRKANEAILHAEKPTVALIRGTCFGGSFGLALNCDLRIASEDASFAIPAARLGLGYAFDDIARLVYCVGPSATAEILITARRLDAAEALRLQVVQQVFANAGFGAKSAEYLQRIAENAPLTIRSVKRALAELGKAGEAPDAESVHALVEAAFASADYREGRAAFREKRKPDFSGK